MSLKVIHPVVDQHSVIKNQHLQKGILAKMQFSQVFHIKYTNISTNLGVLFVCVSLLRLSQVSQHGSYKLWLPWFERLGNAELLGHKAHVRAQNWLKLGTDLFISPTLAMNSLGSLTFVLQIVSAHFQRPSLNFVPLTFVHISLSLTLFTSFSFSFFFFFL